MLFVGDQRNFCTVNEFMLKDDGSEVNTIEADVLAHVKSLGEWEFSFDVWYN